MKLSEAITRSILSCPHCRSSLVQRVERGPLFKVLSAKKKFQCLNCGVRFVRVPKPTHTYLSLIE